jgi:uncharacterized OB-fold protein
MTQLSMVPAAGSRAYPPRVSAFTQPFWEGLAQGRWQTTCCEACGRQTFPPRPICPHCWSDRVQWAPLATRGTLYSWTRIHAAPAVFAAEAPYAVGIVDLDTGIRLACRLVDSPGVDWRPGMAVEMAVLMFEDGPLFAARPVQSQPE